MASKHLKITGEIVQQWINSLHQQIRHTDKGIIIVTSHEGGNLGIEKAKLVCT